MKLSRLCFGVFFAGLSVQEMAAASTSRTVSDNYSCYNTNVVNINDWREVDILSFAQAAELAGGQALRLPGGDTANYWDWDRGGVVRWNGGREPNTFPYFLPQPIPPALNFESGTNATLDRVEPLITQSGADPIWVMNMNTSYLEKELRHLQEAAALGMSVNRVELGNEQYFNLPNYTRPISQSSNPRRVGGLPTPEDYAALAKEWAIGVRAIFPDADIALTGVVPEQGPAQRIQQWMPALQQKTGDDNLSALDVVDGITLHPYYRAADLGVTKADVGNRARAGQIARDGLNQLRTRINSDALQVPELQDKQIWITEHNVIENGNDIVLGNSWVHALMVDAHTHEFLKDDRTEVSCAHVLTGSPQWQALVDELGLAIDPELRGIADRPVTHDAEAFSRTAIGFVLGQSADVFQEGEASLLYASDAATVWRVQGEDGRDAISAVNANDIDEVVELPEGEIWEVLTYTGDPWSTPSEFDLDVSLELLTGGSLLQLPAFSKIIAFANGDTLPVPDGSSDSAKVPEPASIAGLGLAAAAMFVSGRQGNKNSRPRFSKR